MTRDVDTGMHETNDAVIHPYWIYYSIQFKILHCSTLQLKTKEELFIHSINLLIYLPPTLWTTPNSRSQRYNKKLNRQNFPFLVGTEWEKWMNCFLFQLNEQFLKNQVDNLCFIQLVTVEISFVFYTTLNTLHLMHIS